MKEYNEQVVETLDDAGCIIANKNIIIDNLQARIAELEEENARLRFALADTEALELGTSERLAALQAEIKRLEERRCEICGYAEHHREHTGCLRVQLAAEQLNNKRLRDALQEYIDEHEECQDADDWMAMMCSMEAHHAADEALAQPSDTSALDVYVAEKVKGARK